METKKYKIWRFAYTSCVDELILPSEYNSRVKGKKITQSQYDFACTKQIGLMGE